MQRRAFALIFLMLFCSLLVIMMGHHAWAQEEQKALSLDDLLNIAMEKNPQIIAARERTNQASARLEQAAAGLAPKLDLSANYSKSEGGLADNPFDETYEVAIKLTHLLYSGGSMEAQVESAKLELEASKADELRTIQMVDNGVRVSYYDLQRARSRLNVALEALALAKEHLNEVEALHRNGVVAINEVLRVQVDVSSAELERISAANAVDVALAALEKAIGVSLPKGITMPQPEAEAEVPPFHLPEDPQMEALKLRPELKSLESLRMSAQALARSAAGQARPQIYIQGSGGMIDTNLLPEEDEWRVDLLFQWRLYDRREIESKVTEAKSMAQELLHRISDMENQVKLEVSQASLSLASALQRVNVSQDQVRLAEEDYRMALRRYQTQVGTNIDVLDARVAYIDASNALVNSIYDAYTAYSNLLFAMGATGMEFASIDANTEEGKIQ
ncbi:MAG: outer membrane protein [Synergistaceae bacterium]|nr:outer membrane protein [Synergistaceae bacterium]MDI3532204.1 outer membrane protein [Synergistaceae bacterium]